jgi:nucleoside-diphosphate-sugar epimerase
MSDLTRDPDYFQPGQNSANETEESEQTAKRILVTGGFGFLGSHVVERLLSDPRNQVHVVDDLSSSPLDYRGFFCQLGNPSNLTYSICTIQDFCTNGYLPDFQEVYHLASVVGPAGVLPRAGRIIQSVVDDTYQLIWLSLRCRAKLLDVSTSEVYGGGQNGFCTEDFPKIVPARTTVRLEYAVGKLAAETAIVNTCAVSPLQACIVRPFNIAGPRQSGKGGFVLPRFIEQCLRNQPLTVFGAGNQVRAFTHVKDMAEGLVLAMEKGNSGEAYNLGNPENRITILDLARRVIELTGSKSQITFVDPKTIFGPLYAEAHDKYPDATKAKKEFGWVPKFDVDRIVRDAVEEFRVGHCERC